MYFRTFICLLVKECFLPANIYLFKVNNKNTRIRCEICSKLIMKALEWHLFLVFLFLNWRKSFEFLEEFSKKYTTRSFIKWGVFFYLNGCLIRNFWAHKIYRKYYKVHFAKENDSIRHARRVTISRKMNLISYLSLHFNGTFCLCLFPRKISVSFRP